MPRMPRLAGFLVAGLMLVSGFSARAAEPSPAAAQPFTYTHTIITETTQLSGLSNKDLSELLQQLSQYATDHHSDTVWISHTPPAEVPGLNHLLIAPDDSQPSASANSAGGVAHVVAGTDGTGATAGGQLNGGTAGGAGDVVTPSVLTPALVTPALVTPALVTPALVTPALVTPVVTASSATTLRLSEIYPNTTGDDLDEEFIEIRNTGSEAVFLKGWVLEDASGKQLIFKDEVVIGPGQYYLVDRAMSKISLNNDTESVLLKSPDGALIDQTSYNKTTEGSTFSLINGEWTWTTDRTPGAMNTKPAAPAPIAAAIVTPAAPVVATAPAPVVAATTTPAAVTTVPTITAVAPAEVPTEPALPIVKTLRISELYPNTLGDDLVDEFIEIENTGTAAAPLKGWSLKDASGKTFTFTDSAVIEPSAFFVLTRPLSKLSLNNDEDTLALTSPEGDLIDHVTYKKSVDGKSLSLVNGIHLWTSPTPGLASSVAVAIVEPGNDSELAEPSSAGVESVATTATTVHTASAESSASSNTSSSTAASSNINAADGTVVSVEGIALVAPGVLGKQIFYVDVNGQGIQVFKSDAAFPVIEAGQSVRLNGELSTARDERRVKISKEGSVVPLETTSTLEAKAVSIANVNDALHGQLIETEGQIVTRSADSILLEDEGVQLTIGISEYANIDTTLFAKGDRLKVRGVLVSQTGSLKLKPRAQSDLELINAPVAATATAAITTMTGKEEHQVELVKQAAYIGAGTGAILLALLLRRFHPKFNSTYAANNALAVTPQDVR